MVCQYIVEKGCYLLCIYKHSFTGEKWWSSFPYFQHCFHDETEKCSGVSESSTHQCNWFERSAEYLMVKFLNADLSIKSRSISNKKILREMNSINVVNN